REIGVAAERAGAREAACVHGADRCRPRSRAGEAVATWPMGHAGAGNARSGTPMGDPRRRDPGTSPRRAGHSAADRARCYATAADMRSANRADAHGAAADTHSTEAAAYTPNMTHAADAGTTKAAAAHAGPTKAAATEVAASAASEVA